MHSSSLTAFSCSAVSSDRATNPDPSFLMSCCPTFLVVVRFFGCVTGGCCCPRVLSVPAVVVTVRLFDHVRDAARCRL
jgi:hypothetical protein